MHQEVLDEKGRGRNRRSGDEQERILRFGNCRELRIHTSPSGLQPRELAVRCPAGQEWASLAGHGHPGHLGSSL